MGDFSVTDIYLDVTGECGEFSNVRVPAPSVAKRPDRTGEGTRLAAKRRRIKTWRKRQELKTGLGGDSRCRHKQCAELQSASGKPCGKKRSGTAPQRKLKHWGFIFDENA